MSIINLATDIQRGNGTTVPLRPFLAESPTKTGEREKIAVWREHDQLKALRAVLERDGVPIAEQIRRGVDPRGCTIIRK